MYIELLCAGLSGARWLYHYVPVRLSLGLQHWLQYSWVYKLCHSTLDWVRQTCCSGEPASHLHLLTARCILLLL